jgi:hypothetical protein
MFASGNYKLSAYKEIQMQHKRKRKNRQAYEKPRLRVIELVAEEVLSTGCKSRFGDPKGVAGSGCLTGMCSSTIGS